MAVYDGKVTIDTALNNDGFRRGITEIKGTLGGLTGVAGKLGLALSAAFVGRKVLQLGAECVKLGSDVTEVQNVVDTAFGDMSNKMEAFAQTAIAQFGMSQLAAKKTGSNFMAMAKGMGVANEAAADMALGLTGLSGDVASFFNIDQEVAATKLKSVFTGETESLKEIGVVMTQANLQAHALAQGMDANISAMSQAQLVALRYSYVMDTLALAQGDFARTQNSWANQTRILSMQWQEFMSIIGKALTTILLPLVKVLNTIVAALIRMANAFNAAIQAIFGGSRTELAESGGAAAADDLAAATGALADSSGAAAAGQDELADSTKAAAAAAKKNLAVFDELNVLQGNDSGGGSGGSGGGGGGGGTGAGAAGGITSSEIGNAENKMSKLQVLFNQLKDSFMEGLKLGWGDAGQGVQNILDDLGRIKDSLKEIFDDADVAAAGNRFANSVARALGQVVGSVASIGVSIAENLVGGFSRYLENNKGFIKESLTAIFNIGADLTDMFGNTAGAIATLFRSLGSEGGKALTAGLMGILNNTLLGMIQTFGQTLYTVLYPLLFGPFIDNAEKIRIALSGLFTAVAPLFEGIAQGIGEFYSALNQLYQNVIRPAADFVKSVLSGQLGTFLDNINRVLEKLTGVKDVLNGIGKVLGWLLGGITAVVAAFAAVKVAVGIFTAIGGAISAVVAAVSGIGAAFAGVGTIISGIMGTASLATGAVSATGVAVGALSNPIVLAIAAIGGLVTAGVFLYQNWDTISAKAYEFGGAVYETMYNLGQDLYDVAYNAGSSIYDTAYNFGGQVYDTMYNLGGQLQTVVAAAGEWIKTKWTDIQTSVGATVEALRVDVNTKWQTLVTDVQTLLTGFQTTASAIWTTISTTASTICLTMGTTIQGLWSGMCGALQGVLSGLQGAASAIWSGISGTATGIVSGLVISVQGLWSGMCSSLQGMMSGLQGMFSSIWSAISGIVSGAVNGIISKVQGMIQTIQNAISGVLAALSSLGSKASGAISSAKNVVNAASGRSAAPPAPALFSLPIPALATGAVIPPNHEFLAVLGDQRAGTNVEAPLATIEQAVANVLDGQLDALMAGFEAVVAAIQAQDSTIVIGDETIGRAAARYNRRQSLVTGGRG